MDLGLILNSTRALTLEPYANNIDFIAFTLLINLVTSAIVLISYKTDILNPKAIFSILLDDVFKQPKLIEEKYEYEKWLRDNSNEIRTTIRQMAVISTVLASISLATIAFIVRIDDATTRLESCIGISMMLTSSVLFFWAMGLSFNSSMPSKKITLALRAFQNGDLLATLGVFLFFNGLLWSLSILNALFALVPFVAYILVLFSIRYSLSKSHKNNQDSSKK